LINECNKFNKHFIYASSAGVYGNEGIFSETSKGVPLSPYAWSKYLFDRYVLNNKFNTTYQGIRFFNVYGRYEKHKKEQMSVFHKFYNDSIKMKEIYLFEGSKNIYRDFIYVEDCLNVIEKFFNINESGIWNLGTGKAISFYDIAKYYKFKLNSKIKYISMPPHIKKNYQYFTKSNNIKLFKTIGKYNFKKIEYFIDQQISKKYF
jgi:ADP-L-glycero-D-manno-heptose 6-epimerase